MENSYTQYIASYFVQNSYFLLYLLTDYRPEYYLYISSYGMLWPEWRIKLFVLYIVLRKHPVQNAFRRGWQICVGCVIRHA